MEERNTSQKKDKLTAENWVDIARAFGEKCVAIQHDPNLSSDQKLQKQKALSEEMSKEIQNNPHLSQEDKTNMLNSIKSYTEEWAKVYKILESGPKSDNK